MKEKEEMIFVHKKSHDFTFLIQPQVSWIYVVGLLPTHPTHSTPPLVGLSTGAVFQLGDFLFHQLDFVTALSWQMKIVQLISPA